MWRNRDQFVSGRAEIVRFLTAKWERELDYALRKSLWTFEGNRIAVRFQYECHDAAGQRYRSYGNENWEFDEHGLMRRREASINDLPIDESRAAHLRAPPGRGARQRHPAAVTGRGCLRRFPHGLPRSAGPDRARRRRPAPRQPDEHADAELRAELARALAAGWERLADGAEAACVAAVCVLEDSPLFNAGIGSAVAADGSVWCDASLMGGDGRAGAVACVQGIRHPSVPRWRSPATPRRRAVDRPFGAARRAV